MKIHHLAIYTPDLERLKDFYVTYFRAKAGEKYINPLKGFQSYFLRFNGETQLELMQKDNVSSNPNTNNEYTGLTHFSISVGSAEKVDTLTSMLHNEGFEVVGQPRTTGDGYYESVVLDPDGNRIEITI